MPSATGRRGISVEESEVATDVREKVDGVLTSERSQLENWGRAITRRDLLKVAGTTAAVAALTPLAIACGGGGRGAATPGGGGATPAVTSASGKIQPPGTKVNLDFWNPFTGGDGPYLRRIVDQFNAATPNVAVKFTTQKDLYASLRAGKAANRLPHVSIVHLDAIPQNAADGIFAPINDLITTLGIGANDFTEDVWKNGEWKGQRYGVPLDIHTLSFYWNKDLFRKAGLDPEKPPATKDEFLNAVKSITDKAGADGFKVVSSGGGANFLLGIEWATVFYQNGGQWTNADYTQSTINSEAGVNAATFWKDLLGQGAKQAQSDTEIADFKAGKLGMVMSGIWETNGYADALKENFGAGPVPKLFGDGVWAGSHHMGVTTRQMSADEKQGAYYFIDWISQQSLEWGKAGQLPARKSVRASAEFKAIPGVSAIEAQVPLARFFPPIPAAADMLFGPQGAGQAAVAAVTGKKEAKAALDEAATNITKVLAQNKTKYGY
jgi:multiple sugar transport system substrate-binding protein